MEAFVICGVHRKEYIQTFSCQLAFAVYVCCSEGLQGPACDYSYTLLIYCPFRGTASREPFLLGYKTLMKCTLLRQQQHVEGDYCMNKNTCNCYCYRLCILTDRTNTSKYVLQTCLGLPRADTIIGRFLCYHDHMLICNKSNETVVQK